MSWNLDELSQCGFVFSGIQLRYQMIIQRLNSQNEILGTGPIQVNVPIPDGLATDGVYLVPAGAIDFPLPLITASQVSGQQFIDFFALVSDQAISFKTQGSGSTPNPIRQNGMAMMDSANIPSILVSNSTAYNAHVWFMQARSQVIPEPD